MVNAVKVDFAKMDGLVPGIVQDAKTGEMLMLGFLNEVSYAKTVETGFVTFWSRTRQKLWMKGETSGNRLRVMPCETIFASQSIGAPRNRACEADAANVGDITTSSAISTMPQA